MCGLAGYLGGHWQGDSASVQLKRMTDAIAHRGPDSQGHWLDAEAGVALGHRRLAVVDLSAAGHQPMQSPSGRFVMVFNGEVYNHLVLRASLLGAASKVDWRGHSDTETLLAGFEVWGIQGTIDRSVGMFAFVVWDRLLRSLTLGRDRVGEKPLYYGWQGAGAHAVFLFGSELSALRAHPDFSAEINRDALCLFMRYMSVPSPLSIYQGIFKLPAGTLLTISKQLPDARPQAYWSGIAVARQGVERPYSGTPHQAVDALEEILRGAVRQQMVADVPLGAFLSGGVDSSTVVALMQAQSPHPVKTFTIGFNEQGYNEAPHAKAVARHLGTDHTELYVAPAQARDVITRLPALYDEPFADSSQIPTFLISQMAGQHVTVALSGDAGDELFSGYTRYQLTASLWGRISSMPMPLRRFVAWCLAQLSPSTWNRLAGQTSLARHWTRVGDKVQQGARLLASRSVAELYRGMVSHWPDPAEVVLQGHEPATALTNEVLKMANLSDVQRMMLMDLMTYLPDDILTKVDRAAMGVSLETRVPFLDHRVVEFAWQLPLEYKLRYENNTYTTKWALRQVLYRYVPRELIERPKTGFGVPVAAWLRGPLREWAEELLSESRLKQAGFLNPSPIRIKWAEHLSGRRNWQSQLWGVLMFQAWLEAQ